MTYFLFLFSNSPKLNRLVGLQPAFAGGARLCVCARLSCVRRRRCITTSVVCTCVRVRLRTSDEARICSCVRARTDVPWSYWDSRVLYWYARWCATTRESPPTGVLYYLSARACEWCVCTYVRLCVCVAVLYRSCPVPLSARCPLSPPTPTTLRYDVYARPPTDNRRRCTTSAVTAAAALAVGRRTKWYGRPSVAATSRYVTDIHICCTPIHLTLTHRLN